MNNTIDLRKDTKVITVSISTVIHGIIGAQRFEHLINFPENNLFTHTIICTTHAFVDTSKIWKKAGYTIEFKNKYP